MYKSEVTLSVFYNGQFYAALFEKSDETGYSVCQSFFATRPLDNEILRFVLDGYYSLCFSPPTAGYKSDAIKPAKNPKKRQREAANANKNVGASTKAQMALKLQHEEHKNDLRAKHSGDKKRAADEKYELRAVKRKQKHRGR
jgi:hypothetical protein